MSVIHQDLDENNRITISSLYVNGYLSHEMRKKYKNLSDVFCTPEQILFIALTHFCFSDPEKKQDGFAISTIGMCHSIVKPLLIFSSLIYSIPTKKFCILTIRDVVSGEKIFLSGIAQFKKQEITGMLPCDGHTATCILKNGQWYVFDILIGWLAPIKLDTYLSIMINENGNFQKCPKKINITIHTMDESSASGFNYKSVAYYPQFEIPQIDRSPENIKQVLIDNIKNWNQDKPF